MSTPAAAVVVVMLCFGYNLSGELPIYPYLNYGDDDHLVT
jgi:hypothetical protein